MKSKLPARVALKLFRTGVCRLSQRDFAEAMAPFLGRVTPNSFWGRLEGGRRPTADTIVAIEQMMSRARYRRAMEEHGLQPLTVEDWAADAGG